MKFFKNANKLIFAVMSFVISISFGTIAVANDYNHQKYDKNRVYLEFGDITKDKGNTSKVSTSYGKYGMELFFGDYSKLKLEGLDGKSTVDSFWISNFDVKYFYVGLEHYYQNYIGELAFRSFDIGGNKQQTLEYTAGAIHNFDNGMYIKPTLTTGFIIEEKSASPSFFSSALILKSKNEFFITPKIAIGANLEVPNTNNLVIVTPELYVSSVSAGTSINVDINKFFVKVDCSINKHIESSTISNTAVTLGICF